MSIDAVHNSHMYSACHCKQRMEREREWIHMATVYARGHTQSKAGFRIFCCDQMCILYVSRDLLLLLKLHIIYRRPFPDLHGQ